MATESNETGRDPKSQGIHQIEDVNKTLAHAVESDALHWMRAQPSDSVDLVTASPPYGAESENASRLENASGLPRGQRPLLLLKYGRPQAIRANFPEETVHTVQTCFH